MVAYFCPFRCMINKLWIVLFRKMQPPNYDSVCIQIEERALALWNLFAQTVEVMRLHLSKKNDPLLIFTFFKTFPTMHFSFFIIIIDALSFMWVPGN